MRNDRRTVYRARMAGAVLALYEGRRRDVISMVEACGVDKAYIPFDTSLWRRGDSVFLERFLLDDAGKVRWSEQHQGPETEEIEIQPPAHLIPKWLPVD